MSTETIRFTEELTLNAWPALQAVYYDGWVLRFAAGYTRRANSVNSLSLSTVETRAKIRYCEQVYSAHGQDSVFKLTPAVQPRDLDRVLDEEGYRAEALTSVQTLDLANIEAASDAGAVATASQVTDSWLEAYCRLNSVDPCRLPTMTQILANIVPTRCFMALQQEGETVATGLAVLERGYVGLFDIVTAAPWRNRGLGRQLLLHLLNWGRANGAHHAYLLVMRDNAPALHLYARLGFAEIYPYWYRVSTVRK